MATQFSAAVALYEASAWTRAGAVTVTFSDGTMLDEYVFIGPAVTPD